MKIDYALILCAGLGTRMGPIGEQLPKPLWPIFEKTLLELQIKFVKELGCEKVFINTHHQADALREFVEDLNEDGVELIFEPEILGTGGAVHNVAHNLGYKGSFLYLASDQFYFFDENYLKDALELIKKHPVALFGFEFNEDSTYAHLEMKSGFLKGISKPQIGPGVTFSGMGLINLAKLKRSNGFSGFFDSVCLFKENDIPVILPDGEYLDWGQAGHFYQGMFELLKGSPESFYNFAQKWGVFDSEKIKQGFYGPGLNLINLTASKIPNSSNARAIVLKEGTSKIDKNGLYFENIIHEFLA